MTPRKPPLLTRAGPLLAGALCILALDLARAVLELARSGHALDWVVCKCLQAQPHFADASLLTLGISYLQHHRFIALLNTATSLVKETLYMGRQPLHF